MARCKRWNHGRSAERRRATPKPPTREPRLTLHRYDEETIRAALEHRGLKRIEQVRFRNNRRSILSFRQHGGGIRLSLHAAFRAAPDDLLDAVVACVSPRTTPDARADARSRIRDWPLLARCLREARTWWGRPAARLCGQRGTAGAPARAVRGAERGALRRSPPAGGPAPAERKDAAASRPLRARGRGGRIPQDCEGDRARPRPDAGGERRAAGGDDASRDGPRCSLDLRGRWRPRPGVEALGAPRRLRGSRLHADPGEALSASGSPRAARSGQQLPGGLTHGDARSPGSLIGSRGFFRSDAFARAQRMNFSVVSTRRRAWWRMFALSSSPSGSPPAVTLAP